MTAEEQVVHRALLARIAALELELQEKDKVLGRKNAFFHSLYYELNRAGNCPKDEVGTAKWADKYYALANRCNDEAQM